MRVSQEADTRMRTDLRSDAVRVLQSTSPNEPCDLVQKVISYHTVPVPGRPVSGLQRHSEQLESLQCVCDISQGRNICLMTGRRVSSM